ncbi:MAG: hypothetical protein K6T16_01860 [Candidatus Pacearchaeota archaeon]|nr:hypothetical protein [Candidatus Pacearchaeota archaeon]
MNKDKLADVIIKTLGIGALAGLGALVWNFGIKPALKENRDYNSLIHADSTIEYSGTIWSAWKKYGEPNGISWGVYKKAIVDRNEIKDEDFPGKYNVPIPKSNP